MAVRATVNADTGTPGPQGLAGAWREGSWYAWYVCVVMMLLLAISYMDRSVLALLVAPIESAFSVRDTTMGLLQGAAFAVVYVIFAFPLARLADRGNRRNLIVYGVIFWCVATIGCGLARNIQQLFLARIPGRLCDGPERKRFFLHRVGGRLQLR